MKNLIFAVIFIIALSFVYEDIGDDLKTCDDECLSQYVLPSDTKDTLKVVKDTTFYMSMSTNNPFRGKRIFTINLDEIDDTCAYYPLRNSKVISGYGYRDGRKHSGVDIKTRPNDDILAAFDGRVVMAQYYAGYGNYIILRHANGLETLYSHNSKNFVKVGDNVKAGQVIALTGRTGRATTEHLHFECRIKGQNFDPGKLFDHSAEKLRDGHVVFKNRGSNVKVEWVKSDKEKGL